MTNIPTDHSYSIQYHHHNTQHSNLNSDEIWMDDIDEEAMAPYLKDLPTTLPLLSEHDITHTLNEAPAHNVTKIDQQNISDFVVDIKKTMEEEQYVIISHNLSHLPILNTNCVSTHSPSPISSDSFEISEEEVLAAIAHDNKQGSSSEEHRQPTSILLHIDRQTNPMSQSKDIL